MGINETDYDPLRHGLIFNTSCTTTCLAHMIKSLIDFSGTDRTVSVAETI